MKQISTLLFAGIGTYLSSYISAGHRLRLDNRSVFDAVMNEVQYGEFLGKDDNVRFQDVYGRG
jgi:hypothetical protein